jgi:hypothetical protein
MMRSVWRESQFGTLEIVERWNGILGLIEMEDPRTGEKDGKDDRRDLVWRVVVVTSWHCKV